MVSVSSSPLVTKSRAFVVALFSDLESEDLGVSLSFLFQICYAGQETVCLSI